MEQKVVLLVTLETLFEQSADQARKEVADQLHDMEDYKITSVEVTR